MGCPNQDQGHSDNTSKPTDSGAVTFTGIDFKAEQAPATQTHGSSIAHSPSDLPPSIGKRAPQHIRVDLEAVELEGQLADGTTYTYMTFNKLVPGPLLRVRVNDTVELHLKNLRPIN